jgi:cytoskeleton-associated protein 5
LCLGEIGQVLKARVTDTNKAVQTLALDIVARIAVGMGKPFEKHTRFFALPVATVLADQKAPIRAAAIQTLTSIATACESLDSMVHGLTTALESTNPMQRASLLNWIQDWFKEHEPSSGLDLSGWASSVVSCLDDRSGDVRKTAQAILPIVITCAGFDYVMQQTTSLKPASRATAIPLIQAARATAQASAATGSVVQVKSAPKPAAISTPPPTSTSPPQSPTTSTVPVAKAGPSTKLTGVRRKLPQGTNSRPESRVDEMPASRVPGKSSIGGLKRPGAATTTTRTAQSPVAFNLLFSGTNVDAKKARLGKDAQKWINEAGPTRKDLAELLQHQMEPHVSKDLVAHLFSHDHNAINDHLSGLTKMVDFYSSAQATEETNGIPLEEMRAIALANFDLPLKYVSIKGHEPQSNLISKCLDVVDAVLGFLRSVNCQLTDAEALCFIPTMVYKARHQSSLFPMYN